MVDDAGSLPASVSPSRKLKNGRASTTMTARATTLRIAARPSNALGPAQPEALHPLLPGGPCSVSRRRSARRSAFMPKNPSMAGSRVSEASIVSATTKVADRATP